MPTFGNIVIPDDVAVNAEIPAGERPGYGALLANAAKQTYAQMRYGIPLAAETLQGTATPEDQRFYQAGLAAAQGGPQAAQVSDWTSGRVGLARLLGENLVTSLPQMAGMIAGTVGGAAIGGPVGAAVGMVAGGVPTFLGSNVDRAVQENGSLSYDNAVKSLAAAPLQAATDAVAERFMPGVGKLLGPLGAKVEGNFIGGIVSHAIKGGASEAVAEASQQAGERWSAGKPLDNAEAAQEYVNAAVIAFGMGGVLGGAGGVFNRHNVPALTKSPGEITTEDLDHSSQQLLALPAPADMIGRPDGTTAVNPSGRTPLMLPAPGQFAQPDMLADSQGNTAPNLPGAEAALVAARNAPQPSQPDTRLDNVTPEPLLALPSPEMFARAAGGPELLAPGTIIVDAAGRAVAPGQTVLADVSAARPPAAVAAEAPSAGVVLANTPRTGDMRAGERPFQGVDMADLQKARNTKNADPTVISAIDTELEARKAEDPFIGVRMNQDLAKLKGSNTEDLRAGVLKLLDDGDTRKGTMDVAQRLGIDLEAKGAPIASTTDLDARPGEQAAAPAQLEAAAASTALDAAPITQENATKLETPSTEVAGGTGGVATSQPTGGEAALASPQVQTPRVSVGSQENTDFSKDWDELKKSAGVQRAQSVLGGTPQSLADAQGRVMDALANDSRTPEGGPSVVERLARKMGLVTDDESMDVTPEGRAAWLGTRAGVEETHATARSLGYADDAQRSAFEQGVRAQATGAEATSSYSDFGDKAAYEAGQTWAQEFKTNGDVKTAAQTAKIRERDAARKAATNEAPRERAPKSPEQIQRLALNKLVDTADLTGVADQDIAELRRQIAEGATPADVGQALQKLQGGETIRTAPPARPVERSAYDNRQRQPSFRELRGDPVAAKAAGVSTQTREQMRAETEGAVEAYKQRQLIEAAKAAGAITETRAEKLHQMLDEGKVDQVARNTARFDSKGTTTNPLRDSVRKGLEERSQALEQAVDGKSFGEVLDHVINEAPSTYHRALMKGVRGLMQKLEKLGTKFEFKVLHEGDEAPAAFQTDGVQALAETSMNPPRVTIYMLGADMGWNGGLSFEKIAHEMIHGVTQEAIDFYGQNTTRLGDKLGHAIYNLQELGYSVADYLSAKMEAGTLSKFEQRIADSGVNALDNVHELLAWGLTNPDMQRFLAGIEYKPRQSLWSRFVGLIRDILGAGADGVQVSHTSALGELLRVSEQIMGSSQSELASMFMRNRADGFGRRVLSAAMRDNPDVSAANRTATAANETLQKAVGALDGALGQLGTGRADLNVKSRRTIMGWLSHNMLNRVWGHVVPGAVEHSEAHDYRRAVQGRIELLGDQAVQAYEELEKSASNQAKWVSQLMASTTEFQIDPDKAWDEHTWIKPEDQARIKPLYDQAVKMKNDLSRNGGAGWKAFTEFRTLNEVQNLARMAVGLYDHVASDRELQLGIANWSDPMAEFLRANLDTSAKVKAFWDQKLGQQLETARAFVQAKYGEVATESASNQRAMRQHLSPLEMRIRDVHEARNAMDKAPYFHLGRFGDNFGKGMITRNADGTVNMQAQKAVAAALEKAGFTNAQLSADNTRPVVYLRFDTVDQEQAFRKVAAELEAQGHFEQGSATSGPRERSDNFGVSEGLPAFVSAVIQNIEASETFQHEDWMSPADKAALDEQKERVIQQLRDAWIEHQPDHSISKVLVQRNTTPGFDPNMVRNWKVRWRMGSNNLANVASRSRFDQAFTGMKAQYQDATKVNSGKDPHVVRDMLTELKMRDARVPVNDMADTFDKMRGFAHSYFLGFSPAYGLINLTQLGATVLPELAKKHGYTASFHALRRGMAEAYEVAKAVGVEAGKLGWQNIGDVAITDRVLANAKISPETRKFITNMMASGKIDIGSLARQYGQINAKGAEGRLGQVAAAGNTYLKLSSAIGLYTETFSRLATALAARDLHGSSGPEAQAYAAHAISESNFDYTSSNTARQLGKRGILGPVTPMVTQFMSYQVQMLEKLYSEFTSAAGKVRPGESAAEAAQRATESRRFLAGHLSAITALSGTLGLPFTTVFASLLERLFGDDDEPLDATAAYRDFLASVLGKPVAEVVARGLPHALGADVSQRAGEQNLLPFSEFFADKRGWKDAVSNFAGRGLGAVPSMFQNVLEGGSAMANGDVLGGMKQVLPVWLKSGVEFYRMTQDGYVDGKGDKLPLTPKAASYMWQLLGFSPAEKAEYQEAKLDQMTRRGELTRRSGQLGDQIVRALLAGDHAQATDLVGQAASFDQANPAFAVLPRLAGRVARQQQARARAVALQAPIGVSVKDIAGQGLTQYANVDYRQ